MAKITYQECYRKLLDEVATIIFIKGNGEIRTMLATKNRAAAALINNEPDKDYGYEIAKVDSRCSLGNGNMAVIDAFIGEGRCFKMDRLVDIHFHGEVHTQEDADKVYSEFKEFDAEYKKELKEVTSLDDI